jgi:ABC-type multidrug transport system ATPase subunit
VYENTSPGAQRKGERLEWQLTITPESSAAIGKEKAVANVVEVQGLRKAHGATMAVAEVSFHVSDGEIFGMVGPNGAGKTTTIECIEGLRVPDAGTIRVLGLDPQRDGRALRSVAGIQLQQSSLPARIRVWEALDLYASFYPRAAHGGICSSCWA